MAQSQREKGTLKGVLREKEEFTIRHWPMSFVAEDTSLKRAVNTAYMEYAEYCMTFIKMHSDSERSYFIQKVEQQPNMIYRDPLTAQYNFIVTAMFIVKEVVNKKKPVAPRETIELSEMAISFA